MPAPAVDALAQPIRAMLAMVGPGWAAGSHPAESLAEVRDHVAALAARTAVSWAVTGAGWSGAAAEAARDTTGVTLAALDALGERAARLAAVAADASDVVARARGRLQRILDEFEAYAAAVDLDAAGSADALAAAARRALAEATAVVDELREELGARAASVAESPAATVPASASPSGLAGPLGLGGVGAAPLGVGSAAGAAPLGVGSAAGAGWGSTTAGPRSATAAPAPAHPHTHPGDTRPPGDPGMFGSGVAVVLPDGSTATAPNAAAAGAVRYALTQLGVPYCWGGTSPGVGLDCSGLTQWAYHEAGVDLPRLAQEQDIGTAVARNALRPGDLAVWDGHVAMIVGNGTMIEAGDPVHLSPIRTTNAGQGFQGFWRPTA